MNGFLIFILNLFLFSLILFLWKIKSEACLNTFFIINLAQLLLINALGHPEKWWKLKTIDFQNYTDDGLMSIISRYHDKINFA